jgi:ArsR family transcriptional regulator, lead/cadmium/zinc/bismuth-responsive transcriptional repressor
MRRLIPINAEAVAGAGAALPSPDLLTVVVEAFGALADPTRARIVYALGCGPLCVRDLAIVTGVSESAMSHQLRLLRDRRVVKARREGTTMYYSVDDQHVAALLREAEYHADHVRQGLPDHIPYPPAARASPEAE